MLDVVFEKRLSILLGDEPVGEDDLELCVFWSEPGIQ